MNNCMDVSTVLNDAQRQQLESLDENDVLILDHIESLPVDANFRTEAYIALMCLGGKATCRIGASTLELGPDDVFLCNPNQFVENAMASLDFKCIVLLMSQSYIENFLILGGDKWSTKYIVKTTPVIHLEAEERDLFLRDIAYLRQKMAEPHTLHHKEIISLLLQSMTYEFFDCVNPKLQLIGYSYTSAEMLFNRFMEMATVDGIVNRQVKFYADQLCITPKYLSVVCKRVMGKSPSSILNSLTAEHIRRMLRNTNKSVKEIATEANFANLSAFGKFVRRELGTSPRQLRMQMKESLGGQQPATV